ncbi:MULTISPECIES: hypothetical protein [unclassified Rathayibacter]|uniref:hypothetical protein n=1 Tax=unclassified Rathayibacter TaxID=2609250 RepID=UPI0006FE6715|nr:MULTISPECIES: hypothetical protein [unclassified Rathayibacter]KQQ00914.1 hypothetical protein ASF42_16555 [Rathayibacter sp. Leaf294]KQS10317.1 hypothetical protein ASG06_16555 [Rathayibacter sp. Leaf185]
MQLALWVALALLLSLICSRRLLLPVSVVLLTTLLVPVVASGVIVGGGLPGLAGMYPSTYFIMVLAGSQVLLRLREYVADLAQSVPLVLALVLFIGAALVFTYFTTRIAGLSFVLNQIVAPVLLFAVIRRALADDPRAGRSLALVVVAGGAYESVVSILVWSGTIPQPFAASYENYYWFTEEFTRALGTTDHPLVLSVLLVAAVALLITVKNSALRTGLAVLFLVAIVLTQSRTGLLLSLVALGFLLLRSRSSLQARLVLLLGLLVAGGIYTNSALTEGISEKFVDDGGSGAVRGIAIEYVFSRFQDYAVLGLGPGSASRFATEAGLGTSLENPLLIYSIEYGAAFALIYFGAQFLLPLMARRSARSVPGARLCALLVLIAVQTFSSVSTSNSLGVVVWALLAIASPPLTTVEPAPRTAERRVARTHRPPGSVWSPPAAVRIRPSPSHSAGRRSALPAKTPLEPRQGAPDLHEIAPTEPDER